MSRRRRLPQTAYGHAGDTLIAMDIDMDMIAIHEGVEIALEIKQNEDGNWVVDSYQLKWPAERFATDCAFTTKELARRSALDQAYQYIDQHYMLAKELKLAPRH
jgi:hypothetical protein